MSAKKQYAGEVDFWEILSFSQLSEQVEKSADGLGEWFIDRIPVIGYLVYIGVFLQQIPAVGPVVAFPITIFFLGLPLIFEVFNVYLGFLAIPIIILATGQIPRPQFLPGGASVIWLRFIEKHMHLRVLLPIPFISIPWIWFAWPLLGASLIILSPFMWVISLLSRLFHNPKAENTSSKKPLRSKMIIGGVVAVAFVVLCWASPLVMNPLFTEAVTPLSTEEMTGTALAQVTENYIANITGTAWFYTNQTEVAAPTVTAQARDAYLESITAKSQLIFGPRNGKIKPSTDANNVSLNESAIEEFSDFIATATFQNPYLFTKGSWSYGFAFRATKNYTYYLWINSDGKWILANNKPGQVSVIEEDHLYNIDRSENGRNTIRIFCIGGKGLLFINGEFVSELDLSEHRGSGFLFIGSGFTNTDLTGFETTYEAFSIRKIP